MPSQHPVASTSVHADHEVEVTTYGVGHGAQNLAVECLDCQEVIADADLSDKPNFVEVYKAFSAILTRMTFDTLGVSRECPDCSEVDGKCAECQLNEAP